MNALSNAVYDITKEGWDIVASPRHADVLTVTGPMTTAMRDAAARTVDAVAQPRIVVAIGDCAAGEGPWAGAPYAGVGAALELQAAITIRGCPPTPSTIKEGLRRAARALDQPSQAESIARRPDPQSHEGVAEPVVAVRKDIC